MVGVGECVNKISFTCKLILPYFHVPLWLIHQHFPGAESEKQAANPWSVVDSAIDLSFASAIDLSFC